jgi:cytoskeletal protein CcmA (bactofilin family)
MWNKDEQEGSAAMPGQQQNTPRATTRIGPSVAIRGTLKGAEDLHLEGRVDGEILAPKNRVVIGQGGAIKANVSASVIEVQGKVTGDLIGGERVVVAATGHVHGNIKAPRVSLENGAQFKGAIDMDPAEAPAATKPAAVKPAPVERTPVERKGPKPADGPAVLPAEGSKANATNS